MSNELATIPPAQLTQRFAFDDVVKMGKVIAASGLFGVKTPEQAVALMLLAQAQGLHPATAAMEYHIIDGKPALKTDVMLGRFQQAGGRVEWIEHTDSKVSAKFSHPQGGEIIIDWDMQRARTAGLGGKQNWLKYPRQMLRARVISEGIRAVFPAIQQGLYTPEEVQDFEPVNAEPVGYAETPMVITDGSRNKPHSGFTAKEQAEIESTRAAIAARAEVVEVPPIEGVVHISDALPELGTNFDDLPRAYCPPLGEPLIMQVMDGKAFQRGVRYDLLYQDGKGELHELPGVVYWSLAHAQERSGLQNPGEYRDNIRGVLKLKPNKQTGQDDLVLSDLEYMVKPIADADGNLNPLSTGD